MTLSTTGELSAGESPVRDSTGTLRRRRDASTYVTAIVLVAAFVLAGAVRLYRLEAPGVLVDRDFTSAILARDFYFRGSADVPPWRKDMAAQLRRNQPVLEPPVTEFLVAATYSVAGAEDVRLARLMTSVFWLLSGGVLYGLTRRLVGQTAAVFGTIYYLFVPSGILLSRSFQPEALMMLTFVGALFGVWLHHEHPSSTRLAAAGSVAGLTVLHRPLVLFALLGAFAALASARHGKKGLMRPDTAVFALLTVLPAATYYGYGTLIADFMRWKVDTSFRPHLVMHHEFWSGWISTAAAQFGTAVPIAALIGTTLLRRRAARALVAGLTGGYVVFGLVFTMHIHTHGYYHAQLLPVLAICIGVLAAELTSRLREACQTWTAWVAPACAIMLIAWSAQAELRSRLGAQTFESETLAREVGTLVRHSTKVVFLAPYYGLPLQYRGELTGAYWPRRIRTSALYRTASDRELSVAERLNDLPFTPDYFVITHFTEYNRHHADLAEYLSSNCAVIAERAQYMIYGSCATPSSSSVVDGIGDLTSSALRRSTKQRLDLAGWP